MRDENTTKEQIAFKGFGKFLMNNVVKEKQSRLSGFRELGEFVHLTSATQNEDSLAIAKGDFLNAFRQSNSVYSPTSMYARGTVLGSRNAVNAKPHAVQLKNIFDWGKGASKPYQPVSMLLTQTGIDYFRYSRGVVNNRSVYLEDTISSSDMSRDFYAVVDIDIAVNRQDHLYDEATREQYLKEVYFFAESFLHALPKELEPSNILFSGRGLRLEYVWNQVFFWGSRTKTVATSDLEANDIQFSKDVRRKLNTMIQEELTKFIYEYGGTPFEAKVSVDNVSERVLTQGFSVAGSYNKKSGFLATYLFIGESRHDLSQLSQYYSEEYRVPIIPKQAKKKTGKRNKPASKQMDLSNPTIARKFHEIRLAKVQELIKLRLENKTLIGTRNKLICQLAVEVSLSHPEWTDNEVVYEVENICKATMKNLVPKQKEIREPAKSICKSLRNKKYNFLTNKNIEQWLEMTTYEQKVVAFSNTKRTTERLLKKQAKEYRQEQLYLAATNTPELTNQELASLFNINRTTVPAWFKNGSRINKENIKRRKNFKKKKYFAYKTARLYLNARNLKKLKEQLKNKKQVNSVSQGIKKLLKQELTRYSNTKGFKTTIKTKGSQPSGPPIKRSCTTK